MKPFAAVFRSNLFLAAALSLIQISIQWHQSDDSHGLRWKRQACGSNEFKCRSGECIAKSLVCNGERNCEDRSDETSETCINNIVPILASYLQPPLISYAKKCPPDNFQCNYGACVNKAARCNGKKECADGSDEDGCTSTGPSSGPPQSQDGCSLSSQISNGEYEIGCVSPPCNGPIVPRLTTLTFKCNKGYILSGTPFMWCDKQWSSPFPSCNPVLCPPLENPTRQIQCSVDGKQVNCKEPMVPGTRAQVKCLSQYSADKADTLEYDTICTQDGEWSRKVESCATTLCPPLIFTSRDIECTQDGKRVDCSKPMASGTRAAVRCNVQYTQIREFATYDTVCGEGGRWSREVVPCRPICGLPNADGTPLLSHGFEVKKGEYPWHAAIYRQKPDGSMEQICGGSIISPRAIVSAAHCFYDEGNAKPQDAGIFRVVVGKYYRDWNRVSNYSYTQEIDRIVLHDRYLGSENLYESDIAVIITKDEIKMNVAVKPVCVDYDKTFINLFIPGVLGLVLGWGATESNTPSDTLRAATLPYISYAECREKVPVSFRAFLSHDKFCAGYVNGTSVCRGDSGGGYSIQVEGKYYLTGVVSVGVPSETDCNLSQYTAFTKISEYYTFLRNLSE